MGLSEESIKMNPTADLGGSTFPFTGDSPALATAASEGNSLKELPNTHALTSGPCATGTKEPYILRICSPPYDLWACFTLFTSLIGRLEKLRSDHHDDTSPKTRLHRRVCQN